MMKVSNRFLLSGLALLSASVVEGWGEDLPWIDLENKLNPSADLLNTSPAEYLGECTAELELTLTLNSTMHALIDQPSGLCMAHHFCAFDYCYPNPDAASATVNQRITDYRSVSESPYVGGPQIQAWTKDVNNPSYNLPSKVLFPVVASDVVAAVKFAKEHGLEISVKNSGHNYNGASTKKDTLHINMNRYTHYTRVSVTDCDADNSVIDPETLDGQPCALSVAKNKTAIIRIGGGENWDKTYRAVRAANVAQEDGVFKYHVVGGAAATVSPMGWTFQGGLSGTTAGRFHGFGVDQVIQVEMVLPNGQHVRFGPTEWEDVPNAVPKTTKVSGICRTNPLEQIEEHWNWFECPMNINFDELWFAVRGGGGGTWGVVLSLYYQLHPYLPYERIDLVAYPPDALVGLEPSQQEYVETAFRMFMIRYLLDPDTIGANPEESNACGKTVGPVSFSCYGEGSARVFDVTWRQYLDNNLRQPLIDQGIPASFVNASVECTNCSIVEKSQDYASYSLFPEGHRFAGRVSVDDGVVIATQRPANVIIPKNYLLDADNIELATQTFSPISGYQAFGGRNSGATSDQANSLSQAHRDGGYMLFFFPYSVPGVNTTYDDRFFSTILPQLYDTSNPEEFPGFIGSNHAGPLIMGPLKDDWTKACPLELTEVERDEKCIPLQEAIYGSTLLARLEAIKEAIDPDYMFDCYKCIGNNRAKPSGASSAVPSASPTSEPSSQPSRRPSSAPSSSPSSTAYAMVVVIGSLLLV